MNSMFNQNTPGQIGGAYGTGQTNGRQRSPDYLDPNMINNRNQLGSQMNNNRSRSRAGAGVNSRAGGRDGIPSGRSVQQNSLGVTSRAAQNQDNLSLFDVVHGTSQSRAMVGQGKSSRFTNQGRVSAAVHDYNLADSPSRVNPNKALLREREGASDHNQEAAYRRENYEIFRRNLEEAFNQYNVNQDEYLSKEEFKNFMRAKAQHTQQTFNEDQLDQIFLEMDADQNGMIDVQEFIDMQFKAFKNFEDNIEFLAKDIKEMDDKIKEVELKLSSLKERDSGYKIDGIPIMKGSTLTFNIIDGEFDDQFFDINGFEPMINIVVNEGTMEQNQEATSVIKGEQSMAPMWKQILSFDIIKPQDEVAIQIVNNFQNQREILAEKRFTLQDIGHNEEDPLHELKTQRRIEDILLISNLEMDTIGQIKYQATWIYNKHNFLNELLRTMKSEKEDLVDEIKQQDQKLQLIAKPFGGYRNIIAIDDLYFEDAYVPQNVKEFLKVRHFEEKVNQRFNLTMSRFGWKDTRWGRLTIYMFGVWTILTSFCCFEKVDFLNLTVGIMGLFLLLDPQQIKLSYLRLLTFSLPLTLLYDFVWIYEKSQEYWDDPGEGGLEQVILMLVYMMFVYKLILFVVMWKASLNFPKFVKQQRELVGLR